MKYNRIINFKTPYKGLFPALALMLMLFSSATASAREYTQENPLVYEDVYDLWPYSFLNDRGNPDGFDVDLIKMLLDRLEIPYIIKMKPSQAALNDLKSGKSDLMMGLAVGFHDAYGHYGQNSITLFTQSVLSPKKKPTTIRSFRDLETHKVIVNDSSLCHHLMIAYHYEQNALPTKNMMSTILKMSTDEEGELIWNTLSLKWLLKKYNIDNLELTPVNMTHGEFKFMSNDDRLLHQLDSVYAIINSTESLTPLYNKWFYPERKEESIPVWIWWASGIVIVLIALLLGYIIYYNIQANAIRKSNKMLNRRLGLILETSGVRLWTYNYFTKQFTWRNEKGQPAYVYAIDEFAQRYSHEDFERLTEVIRQLEHSQPNAQGEEEEIKLHIKAMDAQEDGDKETRDFIIALSILRRTHDGKPIELIGTKKDITEKCIQERKANERIMRYWAILETPMVGILYFDEEGRLENINKRACQMYCCDRDRILAEKPLFYDMLSMDSLPIEQADQYHATQIVEFDRLPEQEHRIHSIECKGKFLNEFSLMHVTDETGALLGMFAICKDISYIARSVEDQTISTNKLHEACQKEKRYIETIDNFIRDGKVRIVSYSPTSHVFTIYNGSQTVQHCLTPTRLITLIDDRMTNKVIRLLSSMDSCTNTAIDTDIRTTLRIKGGYVLYLRIRMLPQLDANNNVKEYMGILRDISELKATEQQLARVEAKTQEIEDTKTAFMRNMMKEIRQPMQKVIDSAAQLKPEYDENYETPIVDSIIDNTSQLTHVINNILYLSRLEAHMVEISRKPTDFTMIFASNCAEGWDKYRRDDVRYIVESHYESLVLEIDGEHLGKAIQELALNAAQYTTSGTIRARYDYIGRRLIISIEDTGCGISPEKLQELNSQMVPGYHVNIGLGLPICNELVKQMGGNLELNSELGLGTTAWITIPCQASIIKRKKLQ